MRIIGLAALLAAAAALSAPLLDAASRSYVVRPSEPVQTSPASQSVQGRTLAVRADASGHFLVVAVVNGRSVEALIDTGATSVTLTFEAAERLGPRDMQRMARALEVVRSTGHPMVYWQDRPTGGIGTEIALHPLVLLPERDWLYARCDLRFERMLDNGALKEVEALLARNLDPTLPVMRAIGVPEIAALLEGELSRDQAIAAGQTATRQYAKRQYTWFRNQPPATWPRTDNKTIAEYDFFVSLFQQGG